MPKKKLGLIVNPIAGLVLSQQKEAGYAAELGSRAVTVETFTRRL